MNMDGCGSSLSETSMGVARLNCLSTLGRRGRREKREGGGRREGERGREGRRKERTTEMKQ